MIAIDFAPGLHGHFLEYVINKFIYGVPSETDNIFQPTGAAHCINWDTIYQKNRIAMCGHFSSFNHDYPKKIEKIIWIKHDPELDFILLVNVFERCHPDTIKSNDFNIEDVRKLHVDFMFDKSATAKDLRNNWFNKLVEFHNGKTTSLKHSTALPVFDFDYRSFFNLPNFILELEKVANFLSMTLKFDLELIDLWKEFMSRNLGFEFYQKTNRLLEKIISNERDEIDNDWRIHAYINYRLSEIFRLHDGIIFEQEQYPTDTATIHDLIQSHVESFDLRF